MKTIIRESIAMIILICAIMLILVTLFFDYIKENSIEISSATYQMSKEDNIFFAKRKLVDNIYKSANLEGIAVTFADIYSFMNNVNTGTISVDDMLKLKGLKDSWEYILNTIDDDLTLNYIKKIHFEICKGQNVKPLGEFRDKGVGITGTTWRPKLPSECNYEEELNSLLSISNNLERCISTNNMEELKIWIYENCIDGI